MVKIMHGDEYTRDGAQMWMGIESVVPVQLSTRNVTRLVDIFVVLGILTCDNDKGFCLSVPPSVGPC